MLFGFLNAEEKKIYDKQMYELLKDVMDENGKVPKEDWRTADRIVRKMMITMKKNGIL
jgi:NAD/NADP transhydrogenase alpha subunit